MCLKPKCYAKEKQKKLFTQEIHWSFVESFISFIYFVSTVCCGWNGWMTPIMAGKDLSSQPARCNKVQQGAENHGVPCPRVFSRIFSDLSVGHDSKWFHLFLSCKVCLLSFEHWNSKHLMSGSSPTSSSFSTSELSWFLAGHRSAIAWNLALCFKNNYNKILQLKLLRYSFKKIHFFSKSATKHYANCVELLFEND